MFKGGVRPNRNASPTPSFVGASGGVGLSEIDFLRAKPPPRGFSTSRCGVEDRRFSSRGCALIHRSLHSNVCDIFLFSY